ncbi:Cocaine esterase [Colletotrichum higginsianum]|uniref:Cocaine esterase n=1 Tax=Colletotrichum higginsianum TaxID=80884 RepID=A0A4T0WCW5_9PEZI|nr:Cocaine esterase [Colletotrichum higginsianum]
MADIEILQVELEKTRRLGKFVKAWDPSILGVREANPRTVIEGDLISDLDIAVPVRDGTILRGNVHRPLGQEGQKLPVLFNYTVYGKDGATDISIFPASTGLEKDRITEHYIFEAADPGWWCPRGYAVAYVDARGSCQSDGDKSYYSRDVGLDGYDIVEWLAKQQWSNGKVGMYGASGYAMLQYLVAAEQPPSLAAIIPIDGMTDIYREMARKGGIPETHFSEVYPTLYNWGKNLVEDPTDGPKTHPYFDEYWQSKIAALDKIQCPAYVICSWNDHGIHTRGTLNAWEKITSREKYLELHGHQKWEWAALDESLSRHKAFLDHYLLGLSTEIQFWPRVRYVVRERHYVGEWRYSDAFPIPETQYTKLFPTPTGGLSKISQPAEHQVSYDAKEGEVVFELPLRNSLEFVGHAKLRLWVEVAEGGDNLDLFITLRKKDKKGNEVYFPWLTIIDDGPIGFGWLRASRRELDEAKSTPWRPVHLHRRDLEPLKPGDVVCVDIEIQPTSCRFRAGDRLDLVVSGHDYGNFPGLPVVRHNDTINKGRHIIHFGGKYDSHLLLPVLPGFQNSFSRKKSWIKMTIACRRIPGWSEEKFLEEYTGVHAEATRHVSNVVPHLRNYTQVVGLPHVDVKGIPTGGLAAWDAVTTLGWTTLHALWGSFRNPAYKASAGNHVFTDSSAQTGILSQSFAEIMFDPIAFEKLGKKPAVLQVLLARSRAGAHSDPSEADLEARADHVGKIGAGTGLLRYVLNRAVVSSTVESIFEGTPFSTTDWTTMSAFEQYWFPDRESVISFLSENERSGKIFGTLPKSFDLTKSFAVIGDENIVVEKELF